MNTRIVKYENHAETTHTQHSSRVHTEPGQHAAKPQSRLLALPLELRQQIYAQVLSDRPRHHLNLPSSERALFPHPSFNGTQTAYLVPDGAITHGPTLTIDADLVLASSQVHHEVSGFLRTARLGVVARVADLDFTHVKAFLSSLPPEDFAEFFVRADGTAGRVLTVELQGPYDAASWTARLGEWVAWVGAVVGEARHGELATAYKVVATRTTVSTPEGDDPWARVPGAVVTALYAFYKRVPQGGGRIEMFKILMALYCRYRAECIMQFVHGVDVLGYRFF